MKKILDRSIAGLLVFVLMVSCVWRLPNDVYAADEDASSDTGVVYELYTNDEKEKILSHFRDDTAPSYSGEEKCGYLFGGWFTKVTVDSVEKFKPIKNEAELDVAENYYAKFVPAYVLSVKCQNMYGTEHKEGQDNINKTNIRYVAGLDSTNYTEFGFIVHGVDLNKENGNLNKVIPVGKNDGSSEKNKLLDTVYEKLFVYSGENTGTKYTPQKVLGKAAKYFMTYRLDNIKQSNFWRTYSIQPYWKTFDGVEVTGLTKYAHVEDGLYGYVNVPVNLKSTEGVAAGRLEFDWSALNPNGSTAYEFMGAECGMVFDKKVIQEQNDNTIRCIAYSSSIGDKSSDNIYINLRFKPVEGTEAKSYNGEFYSFSVSETQFANYDEEVLGNYTVWDVQY